MSARHRARTRARRSWPQRILLGFGGLLSIVLLVGAAAVGWGWWQLNQISRTDVHLSAAAPEGEPQNWLIVGSDSRAKYGAGAVAEVAGQRSDTIMVLRVDPSRRQAKMLSLPRDLWVRIAGTNQNQRINSAFNRGKQALIDTVQQNFQIPINHYLEVDFKGFQSMVDALGGVPMYFSSAARDKMSGLDVEHPGCVNLDGLSALALARSRHLAYMNRGMWESDPTGDLGRIDRQQLLIRKTIDQAKGSGLNVLRIKRLVEIGTHNITVDRGVSVRDLLDLGRRFQAFDPRSLQTMTVPSTSFRTDGGASVLRIDAAASAPILAQFRDKGAPVPVTAPPTSSVPVIVLNSSDRQGLAANLAGALQKVGFHVVRWGNGSEMGEPSLAGTEVHYAPGGRDEAVLVARHLTEVPRVIEDAKLDDGQVAVLIGQRFTTVQRKAKPANGAVLAAPTTTSPGAAAPTGAPATTAPATTKAPTTTTSTTVVGHLPGDTPPGVSC